MCSIQHVGHFIKKLYSLHSKDRRLEVLVAMIMNATVFLDDTMQMGAAGSSQMLVTIYQTQSDISEIIFIAYILPKSVFLQLCKF
jgi:hypothetical protein